MDEIAGHIDGKFMSAFVRAVKPQEGFGLLLFVRMPTMEGQNLQRAVSLHGQHGPLDHGGGHPSQGRGRTLQRLLGGQPAQGVVNPYALKTLAAYGYPAEDFRSKSWDEYAAPGAPVMDFVFTVCDSAAGEVCPSGLASP